MPDWLTNPKALIVLFCLGVLILGFNAGLFSLLRGNKAAQREAGKWSQVLRGGAEGQRRQDAQLDELHRAVSRFKSDTSRDTADD